MSTENNWALMKTQAKDLKASKWLPKDVKDEVQAFAVISYGREMGFEPWESFEKLDIMFGKPSLNAFGMLSQFKKIYPQAKIRYPVKTSKECTVNIIMADGETYEETFSWADAVTAKLPEGPNKHMWAKFPSRMLRARCITNLMADSFPEVKGPSRYSTEELADIVDVTPRELPQIEAPTVILETSKAVDPQRVAKLLLAFSDKYHVPGKHIELYLGKKENQFDDLTFKKSL